MVRFKIYMKAHPNTVRMLVVRERKESRTTSGLGPKQMWTVVSWAEVGQTL